MQIYLPIAEVSIDVFLLLGMGGAVGFLSGVFGVGGGFLMTPLLIFVGIPPAIAVARDARGRAKGETRTDPAPRALEAAGGPRARARLLGRRHAESPSFLFLLRAGLS